MIDHVSIAVTDLERADAFYTAVLAALGLARLRAEERRVGYGKAYAEFWINFRGGAHDEGDGRHVAFRASSIDAVDAFHRLALANGGRDDGPPGFRDRGVGPNLYYAAFIRDADGNRIEVVTFVPPG